MAKELMIDRDPFSNGSEYDWWESHNCARCKRVSCAIKNDIETRMVCDDPIRLSSYDACQQSKCPRFLDHINRNKPHKRPIEGQLEFNFTC